MRKRRPPVEINYARKIGWHELGNGELIEQAEAAGYEVLLSTDKNIRYPQNLSGGRIALVVLGNSQWPRVWLHLNRIAAFVNAATPSLPNDPISRSITL